MSGIRIKFNQATRRQQGKLGTSVEWRPPIHGCRVLVNEKGKVCGQVRELGMTRPKKDRRYAAKIDGVQWWTTNVLSPQPCFLPLIGFDTAKEAMAAVEEARSIILSTPEEKRLRVFLSNRR